MLLFQNLIGNAIKYRRAGSRREFTSGRKRQDGAWQFSVADNGIGIDSGASRHDLRAVQAPAWNGRLSRQRSRAGHCQENRGARRRPNLGRVFRPGLGVSTLRYRRRTVMHESRAASC